jgi:hypothetical protein
MAARAGARSWADLLLAEEAPVHPGREPPVSPTFELRSVLTSIRPVPAASASGRNSPGPLACGATGRRALPPWPRRPRAGCLAALRTPPRASASDWGRKSKIPPPSLSTTTMRTGVETPRTAGQAANVVQEGEVAGDDRGSAGPRRARRRSPKRGSRRCRWPRGC